MNDNIRIERPPRGTAAIPVVYDSPHSGSIYPADFRFIMDAMTLRRSEDAHIDELYAHVAADGATLLHALFPRCYIDPNRAETDLDATMIDGVWEGPLAPTSKSTARGAGLVWRQVKAFGPIYAGKLAAADVRTRIDTMWRPYHDALAMLIDGTYARFGTAWHVNCHSMAAFGDQTTEDGPVERPDWVIGDRDGTTCAPAFTELVVETLRADGFSVAVNLPYKGMELVRRYSDPARGRHSIQIELKRSRYMDEATLAKNAAYPGTEAALRRLTAAIAAFAADSLA